MQIASYLTQMPLSYLEKDHLLAENGIVYVKYLLAAHDYEKALQTADHFRHQAAIELDDSLLLELTFLTALGFYYTDDKEQACTLFKTAFFSAHAIGSCYATICRDYMQKHLDLILPEVVSALPDIPLPSFPYKRNTAPSLSDGVYDLSSPDALSLGRLIQSLRLERHISQTALCQGLCSKSKLSKIENDTLQPSIILSQTLLQRLGISDRVLNFYGNTTETHLQELQNRILKLRNTQPKLRQAYIRELEELCSPCDSLYFQFLLYQKTSLLPDDADNIALFQNALSITQPDFRFEHISKYCLSWMDISILNALCNLYADSSPAEGFTCFYQLIRYCISDAMDVLERNRFLPVTIGIYTRHLYREKRFREIEALAPMLPYIKSSVYFTGFFYAYLCQTPDNDTSRASVTAYYAYYCFLLMEDLQNAQSIKDCMHHDFHIEIL